MKTIVLCRGSLATPERDDFVRRICAVYPSARVVEALDVSASAVGTGDADRLHRHEEGKRTLVLGELKPQSAVWGNVSKNETYLYRWCFSVYGLCPYDCAYCYLPGTRAARFSPGVKVYVNLPEILGEIDRRANGLGEPSLFYLGKLQDGLALDPLTAYSTDLIPFFARHRYARAMIQTKSDAVERLIGLEHRKATILSWTLNPPEIAGRYEAKAPPIRRRMEAMRRCAVAGYPVYAIVMPIVPEGDWEDLYVEFVRELLATVPLKRLTLGGIALNGEALSLMERRIGRGNPISRHLGRRFTYGDGRVYYAPRFGEALYERVVQCARDLQPELPIFLVRDKGLRGNGPSAWASTAPGNAGNEVPPRPSVPQRG